MSWTNIVNANLNKIVQDLWNVEIPKNEEICPKCEKVYQDEKERKFIEQFGECFECYIKSYQR